VPITLARMSPFTALDGRAIRRRQPGRRRRWSAAEKARYLAAFRRSGGTVAAFCRRTGVPRATFTLWRQDEDHERGDRGARQRVGTARGAGFARVAVRPGIPGVTDAAATPAGITVRVHAPSALTGELIGLDADTALRALRLLLRHQRGARASQGAHRTADA
jgi:transposase-like protein